MTQYPIILNLHGQLAVIVGSGRVGCRKANGLLAAEARVRMVTTGRLADPSLESRIELRQRPFVPQDLAGAKLAFAATGDPDIDRAVLEAGRQFNILVNVAADSDLGDFHLPAILRRGDFLLAIATAGRSPGLARVVRDHMAEQYGPEWAKLVEIIAVLRSRKLTVNNEKSYSYKVLDKLLEEGLPLLIARGQCAAVDQLLTRVLGQKITLAELGLTLRDEPPCLP